MGFYVVCNHGDHRNSKQDVTRVKILSSLKSRTFKTFTLAVSCLGQTNCQYTRLQNIPSMSNKNQVPRTVVGMTPALLCNSRRVQHVRPKRDLRLNMQSATGSVYSPQAYG